MHIKAIPIIAALACLALSGCRETADNADGGTDIRADGPLILAVEPELPPYSYVDEASGEVAGIDIDIVRAAAAILGRPLQIKTMRFADLLPALRKGEADFAAGAITITEGRRHKTDFSDPYAMEGSAFLYRAGETAPTMIRAETMRIGTVESVTHDFYLTRHGIDPVRYAAIEAAVSDLRTRRLDAVFYDRPILLDTAEKSGGALAITPLETRENYGIAVRKGRPELLDAVNRAIRERNAK